MKIISILKEQLSLLMLINDNNTVHKDQLSIGWQELIERVIQSCDSDISYREKCTIIHKEKMIPFYNLDNSERTVIVYLEICYWENLKYITEINSLPQLEQSTKKVLNEIVEALEEVMSFKYSFIK